jgi:tetratricopeptide (TPR) repeat protein
MTSLFEFPATSLITNMDINDVYLWCVTGVTAIVGLNTLWRLWIERDRLSKEDLSEDDRAFAWRVVVFLIFPTIVFLDLRTTSTICELLGGYVKTYTYGLLWYHLEPAGLHAPQLIIPVLFAGSIATSVLALSLLPSLFFRPHPFLATLIGYTSAFVLGLNLIADPLLSIAGLGSLRWPLAMSEGEPSQKVILIAVHLVLAGIYILTLRYSRIRIWFSELSRPNASEELREAISNMQAYPQSARLACKVGLLYDKAGLRRQARKQLKKLRSSFGQSLYCNFLDALIQYRRRDYKTARKAFLFTSDYLGIDGELKASLLAAAACAAFADGDTIGALNLSERALEFSDECLIARMVKVDVFLRQGKKEHAGEELLLAMHMGLSLDLENKVPLDVQKAFDSLVLVEEKRAGRQFVKSGTRV